MAKCILLVRVSTDVQDLAQQTERVMKAAMDDGYDRKDIIVIEDKESAVKLSEEERNGLNRMKKHIEAGNVDCVYTYEISRISRRADVVYSIRNYLIERKIQLVVLNPMFKMLKDDGTLSETSNIFFGIFASMAENEGLIRKQRFARGKAKLKREGKYTGGGVCYGYNVKDGNYVVNEDEAKVLRELFTRYTTEDISTYQLAKEFHERGVFNCKSFMILRPMICEYLQRERYLGTEVGYPQIISQELFDKAQKKMSNKKRVHKSWKHKNVLLKGKVRDKEQNVLLFAQAGSNRYVNNMYAGTRSMKINTLDYIVWCYVVQTHRLFSKYGRTKGLGDMELLIKRNEEKIKNLKKQYELNLDRIDKIEERYILGKISEKKANELGAAFHKDNLSISESINKLTAENEALTVQYNKNMGEINYNELTFEQKVEITNETVKCVYLSGESKYVTHIEIHNNFNGEIKHIVINTRHNVILHNYEINPLVIWSKEMHEKQSNLA